MLFGLIFGSMICIGAKNGPITVDSELFAGSCKFRALGVPPAEHSIPDMFSVAEEDAPEKWGASDWHFHFLDWRNP